MQKHDDVATILARLIDSWPTSDHAPPEVLDQARAWLADRRKGDVRTLAHDTLASLDVLLQALQGGGARDVLFDAREALARYVQHNYGPTDDLTVRLPPSGGVTLVRGGRNMTIGDAEMEQVREAINERKREIRKHERRQARSNQKNA